LPFLALFKLNQPLASANQAQAAIKLIPSPCLNSALSTRHLAPSTATPPKVASITGITGQDGSYLAEFLLAKGYIVHGIKRQASSFNTQRVDHIYQDPYIDNANFKGYYHDLRNICIKINWK